MPAHTLESVLTFVTPTCNAKMDLEDKRQVFVRDGRSFARKNGLAFIETSALDATGIDTAFQRILQEIYNTQARKQPTLGTDGDKGTKAGAAAGNGNAASPYGPQAPAKGEAIKLGASKGEDFSTPQKRKGCC